MRNQPGLCWTLFTIQASRGGPDPRPSRVPIDLRCPQILMVGQFLRDGRITMFRPPTLNGPTLGTPPRDVASASDEIPFPTTTVMPISLFVRFEGTVLVEVHVDI